MSVRILATTSRALSSGSSGRVFAPRAVHSTVHRRKDALFDPYPLPLSPGVVKQQPLSQDSEEWPIPPPLDRTGEDEATLRARLVYQSRKRGTLETDLILATFAREQLPKMSYDELMEFDKLLDEPDWDIFYWAVQKREPPAKWANTRLLQRLIQHAKNEGKVVRIMPALLARGGAPL